MADENQKVAYTDDSIRNLSDRDHVRLRPGMYIGKLGNGSHSDDGIYVLIKEAIDNSIDEFRMGEGNIINVTVRDGKVTVRDFGRGIPQGQNKDGDDVMVIAVSKLNSGAKYDNKTFKKSVGLNGVGLKAVNFLSWKFAIQSWRDGKTRRVDFKQGELVSDSGICDITDNSARGTLIEFEPDYSRGIFENYAFREDYIEPMLRNFVYLNTGLTINFNGRKYHSKNGLLDLLTENLSTEPLYPIIHLKGDDIEMVLTHTNQNGEEYYSFVNGQHTIQGGTHQAAYREAIGKTIKEFFNKNMELADIRNGVAGAIAINVEDPVFESQTKVKLGSLRMANNDDAISVNKFVVDFVKQKLDDFLHKNQPIVDVLLKKIQESERERKEIEGVRKVAKAKVKAVSLHNRKLRDCRYHFNDARSAKDEEKNALIDASSIFLTEGDSASGSITKSRDVNTQAVFSLRGKPLNCFGMSKKVVYENDEFNLLQAALNIEEDMENLRYNKVIIATDADVDGMHIRLLLMTFFLQFFPELVHQGHVFILQTPLFRVRNKKQTVYCYSEAERDAAAEQLGAKSEITRFKGLGEISPDEFKNFIGKDIRLDPVEMRGESVQQLLSYFMGKNTPERQSFIIDNLRIEEDLVEEEK
ncbi:MAG: type IIA DNA topoisomerase subunit B [Salinivirgaceae bacterium]|nr:type IIA DNA topoisomerase subunit B [Salinivirgaceae bacterium]